MRCMKAGCSIQDAHDTQAHHVAESYWFCPTDEGGCGSLTRMELRESGSVLVCPDCKREWMIALVPAEY